MGIKTANICTKNNIPYIFIPFGSLQSSGSFIYKLYDYIFTDKMVRNASYSIGQTPHERDLLKCHGAGSVDVINLPIDIEKLEKYPQNHGFFRKKYNISTGEILIGIISRFHETKGYDYLLELFHALSMKSENIKFVIAGRDDGYEDKIVNKMGELNLSDRIIFINSGVFNQEKVDLLVDMDIFILLPNIYEETVTASLEAAFFNTCLLLNQKAAAPMLEEYNAGLYLKNDLKQDTENIMKIINNREYKRMQEQSRKWVSEEYALNHVIEKHINVFNMILQPHRKQ
ncbi:hypothetical protein ES703_25044 [subsurface metagenome]